MDRVVVRKSVKPKPSRSVEASTDTEPYICYTRARAARSHVLKYRKAQILEPDVPDPQSDPQDEFKDRGPCRACPKCCFLENATEG